MRVLIVQPHMTVFGGAETVVLHLARCLRKLGVQNAVLTLTVSESMRELDPEIEYIVPSGNFTFMSRSTSLKNALGIIPELRALKKTIRRSLDACDILHPHNFPATWAVGRRPRKPVVWMCNEVPDLYNNPDPSPPLRALRAAGLRLDRRIVNTRVSEIVVADEANAAWVKRRYGRESRIISYGIEYERFEAGDGRAIRRRYGLDDAFVMLQVGMLTPQKNQMASLEALMGVLETVPRATLILAGDDTGPYAGKVRRVVAENKLKGRVILTGQISKKDVADYYHACDVALFHKQERRRRLLSRLRRRAFSRPRPGRVARSVRGALGRPAGRRLRHDGGRPTHQNARPRRRDRRLRRRRDRGFPQPRGSSRKSGKGPPLRRGESYLGKVRRKARAPVCVVA